MAILSTIKKGYLLIKTATGYVKLLPRTLATLVSMADGSTVESQITALKGSVSELNSKLTYSTAETQIGIMDGNKLVYRKIAKIPMTNFVNVSSGYDLLYLGIGVLATQIISINMLAYRSSDNRTDALPYSGTGTVFNTWFAGVTVKNGETVLKFHNNVYWGSAYTLIATIEYTKS